MNDPIRQALILAGGRGTRLGAITEAIPKPMLKIAGDKPFLDYLIEMIERHGYEDIVLLGGYLGEVLEAAYDGRRIGGARLRVLRERAPLGTAGALTVARETLDPRFLMMNGDAFFDINLRALEQASLEGGAMATLALRSVGDAARYGRVIEEQGKVVAFLEKDPSRPGPGIINGGIYVLKREILDLVSALPSRWNRTCSRRWSSAAKFGARRSTAISSISACPKRSNRDIGSFQKCACAPPLFLTATRSSMSLTTISFGMRRFNGRRARSRPSGP